MAGGLRMRFEHHVERRLRRPPYPSEPRLGKNRVQPPLAGLRSKREPGWYSQAEIDLRDRLGFYEGVSD